MARHDSEMPLMRDTPDGVVVQVLAQPGSRANAVRGIERDQIKIAVTQVAERGKATKAVLKVLADFLKVSRGQIELISGDSHRQKVVLVRGWSSAQLKQVLDRCFPPE